MTAFCGVHGFLASIILLLSSLFSTSAHSWIEQMQIIDSNGSYTGEPGYPRGYIARTDPRFDGYSDKWQLPSPEHDLGRTRISNSDKLCHPAQRTANYTSDFPKLQVAPDSYVAMKYLENGHVTQPWIPAGKPAGSGPVFVYGTYSPSADEKIVDVLQWTKDGKGGNGKGFLMAAQNYDDGRCHQLNNAPISINRQMQYSDGKPAQESWCETDLHIPADSKSGSTLTLYWVWSWGTSLQTEGAPCGKDEYYTTCADVDIVGVGNDTKQKLAKSSGAHTLVQQDPQKQAVGNYKSRTADVTAPTLITTEGCSVTSMTSSSLPATLTQMTSLPATFLQAMSKGAANAAPSPQAPPAPQSPSAPQAPPAPQSPQSSPSSPKASAPSAAAPSSAASPSVASIRTTTITTVSTEYITVSPSPTAKATSYAPGNSHVHRRMQRFSA